MISRSPWKGGKFGRISPINVNPFANAASDSGGTISSNRRFRSIISLLRCISRASNLASASIWRTIICKRSLSRSIVLRKRAAFSGLCPLLRNRRAYIKIVASGVRNSWTMLWKKSSRMRSTSRIWRRSLNTKIASLICPSSSRIAAPPTIAGTASARCSA